jgi:hypothetical protein
VLTVRGSVRKDSVDVPGIVCVDDSLGRFHLGIEAESVRDIVRAKGRGGVLGPFFTWNGG